jgi:hypothetical protein
MVTKEHSSYDLINTWPESFNNYGLRGEWSDPYSYHVE